ncbi:cyclic nucleotide-binding domain-containing protein, partial [Anaerospora hongkongensis]
MKEMLPALKKTLLFAGIKEEDLINMLACLQPKVCHYDKNETIALAGDGFECIGILVKGEAVVIKENAAGSRHVMTMLQPGDLFGEMVVYAANSAWPATVQARE